MARIGNELSVHEYQDQLDGLIDDVNIKFKQGLERLKQTPNPEMKSNCISTVLSKNEFVETLW